MRGRVVFQSCLGGAVGMTERRTARRYDLSLPVNVRLPINREPAAHNGQTRDISTRGVYFMMQKDLAPGTEVDFTLTLPAEITRGAEVFVRAHGRVVRVDKQQDDQHESIGVAAVIERYSIIPKALRDFSLQHSGKAGSRKCSDFSGECSIFNQQVRLPVPWMTRQFV